MNPGLLSFPGRGGFESPELPVPAANTHVDIQHALYGQPALVRGVLVCKQADNGYKPGDEIDFGLTRQAGTSNAPQALSVSATAGRVTIYRHGSDLSAHQVDAAAIATLTSTNWAVKVYAWGFKLA